MNEVADLGTLPGDVLAFGSIVSNAHALAALVHLACERAIPPQQMVSTGDLVAYCGQPAESVAAFREIGAPAIRGNCEESLAAGAADCGCGFAPGSTCDELAVAWYAHADARLDALARTWMGSLPRFAVFRAHGRRWGVLHGGATVISRFLWPTSPESEFLEEFAAFEEVAGSIDAIVAGHCGLPFLRDVSDRLWFNPGSAGMPPNDGDPRTSFGMITSAGPRIKRLDYDHAAAAGAMRSAGLAQGYEAALETGWWPSEEVLPFELRRPVDR